jgi:carboxylate-amine ligase
MAVFDAPAPLTVGLEEEVMLLHPETLDLHPISAELLERTEGDPRFKAELPAAQVEIVTEPVSDVRDALAALARGRDDLAGAARGLVRLGTAGVHPFAAVEGELGTSPRYRRIEEEYASIARRQLVASLQVHVAVGAAGAVLPVYNALRCRLPEIAALAANAAIHEGRDSGMASMRPKIAENLPRQGVPPALASWEHFAAELEWGAAAGALAEPRMWWWELRPHPEFGTLEVRVADAQTGLGDAAGIAAVVQALVCRLIERHQAGERLADAATWRIDENRWSAARHGVEGEMADLDKGGREPTRDRLNRMLDDLEPVCERLGSAELLADARRLVAENGALRQRRIFRSEGARGVAAWIAEEFTDSGGSRIAR